MIYEKPNLIMFDDNLRTYICPHSRKINSILQGFRDLYSKMLLSKEVIRKKLDNELKHLLLKDKDSLLLSDISNTFDSNIIISALESFNDKLKEIPI